MLTIELFAFYIFLKNTQNTRNLLTDEIIIFIIFFLFFVYQNQDLYTKQKKICTYFIYLLNLLFNIYKATLILKNFTIYQLSIVAFNRIEFTSLLVLVVGTIFTDG